MDNYRAAWTGSIQFGLVNIPVKLYSVNDSKGELRLKTLCECGGEIGQKRFCKCCESEDFQEQKAYCTMSGKEVILDQSEIDGCRPDNDKGITISGFLPGNVVRSRNLSGSGYYVECTNSTAHSCLLGAMDTEGVEAICRVVMRGRERFAVLRASKGKLWLYTLKYTEEVREYAEATTIDSKTSGPEYDLMVQLVRDMALEGTTEALRSLLKDPLRESYESLAEGLDPRPQKAPQGGDVLELTEALKRSLQEVANV